MELILDDLRNGYVTACQRVLSGGRVAAPRGMVTREIEGVHLVVMDPTVALPIGVGRKLHTGLAALEAAQMCGGFSDPQLMVKVAPNTEQFMDGRIFSGAYGPRLRTQFPAIVERLRNDRDTRQAIATIWDPVHDLYDNDLHDIPCTISLRFSIRNEKLNLSTHMRSNDVWWGLAYDGFVFCTLLCTLANWLDLGYGTYRHYVDSFHAYNRDWDSIENLTYAGGEGLRLTGFRHAHFSIQHNMKFVRDLVYAPGSITPLSPSEQWYQDAIQEAIKKHE